MATVTEQIAAQIVVQRESKRESDELILVQSPNGKEAKVANETSGIIATIAAFNMLAWSSKGQRLHDQQYHRLFSYALELPEAGLIHAILD
jgi:Antirestriction protein